MSMSGLEVFDKSLHNTNIWLNEIMEGIGPDRSVAYHVLSAVLHVLRDRLTPDEAADLGAQLPLLIRGIYYDSYRPSRTPTKVRNQEEFLACIEAELQRARIRPVNVKEAARVVMQVLQQHVSDGEIGDVRAALPKDIRRLWPEANGRA